MLREVWIPIPGGAQGIPGGGTECSGDKVGMGHSWDVLGGFFHFDSVVLAGVTHPGQLYRHWGVLAPCAPDVSRGEWWQCNVIVHSNVCAVLAGQKSTALLHCMGTLMLWLGNDPCSSWLDNLFISHSRTSSSKALTILFLQTPGLWTVLAMRALSNHCWNVLKLAILNCVCLAGLAVCAQISACPRSCTHNNNITFFFQDSSCSGPELQHQMCCHRNHLKGEGIVSKLSFLWKMFRASPWFPCFYLCVCTAENKGQFCFCFVHLLVV